MQKFITDFFISGIIGVLLLGAGEFLINRYIRPTTHWFHYESISPSEDNFIIGGTPVFISNAEFRRSGSYEWNDTLKCFVNGEWIFWSVYDSRNEKVTKKPLSPHLWAYQEVVPNTEKRCRIESVTTVVLPWGVRRSQTIISKEFNFIYENKN